MRRAGQKLRDCSAKFVRSPAKTLRIYNRANKTVQFAKDLGWELPANNPESNCLAEAFVKREVVIAMFTAHF